MTASVIMLAIKIKICLCIWILKLDSGFVLSGKRTRPRVPFLAPSPKHFDKVRDDEASSPAREARALPRGAIVRREKAERAHACSQSIRGMTFCPVARYRALPAGTKFLAEGKLRVRRSQHRHEQD